MRIREGQPPGELSGGGGRVSESPVFSVIIPVYRHWHLVPDLLAALAAQSVGPAAVEILVVESCPDPTPDIALPANARRVACPAPGSYAARNAGAAAAQAATLAFTDADCRPDPGWLEAFADAAAGHLTLLAGPVRMVSGENPTRCEIYELIRGIPQARYVRNGYAATANLAVPAAVFRTLGGFDATRFSGGDAEFCRRAGRAGFPVRLVHGAEVAHLCRADWGALATKARRVKGGQVDAGPLPRRLLWALCTLTPPLREAARFLRAEAPLHRRLVAIRLRFALWAVELAELRRLWVGGTPERR
jgi:glycosyltransferase involved in cell wall biosynthesis